MYRPRVQLASNRYEADGYNQYYNPSRHNDDDISIDLEFLISEQSVAFGLVASVWRNALFSNKQARIADNADRISVSSGFQSHQGTSEFVAFIVYNTAMKSFLRCRRSPKHGSTVSLLSLRLSATCVRSF